MSRFVIQSAETFFFLHCSPRSGDVGWTPSLLTAIRNQGVFTEPEHVAQMIEDHCDRRGAVVIDLDEDTE